MRNTEMIKISPSILAGDFVNMENSVKALEKAGADYIHCDVMDGVYVKNLTFGMPMVAAIRKITKVPLDVHLMITEPERYVAEFVKCGADIVTFHPDASKDPEKALLTIKAAGAGCGVVFNPNVPVAPYKDLFPLCDVVLVMSVYAGLGGQKFIEESLERVGEVKKYLAEINRDIPIEIDGGITVDNAVRVIDAGVTMLVAGSSVFRSADMAATIKALRG